MRIAQVAPLFESVPPKFYGGTERVVSSLTEELVRRGHDVTLFASGDSVTKARLVPVCEQALRLDKNSRDHLAHHVVLLERVLREVENFDIVHFHIDYLHFPLARQQQMVNVTTLHGRLDIPDLRPLYKTFSDMPVISISNSQRRPLPWLNWQGTVYHGLPPKYFDFREKPGDYLAFLGRISPEKGVDQAIQIARRAGIKLKIAAKIDPVDHEYFDTTIKPLLKEPGIEFLGEVGYPHKSEFLGGAMAVLFPIVWPEPFGLVMIEAMACGTPVVAYARGSVPEIVEHGATGFVVSNADSAVRAIQNLSIIDRRKCRQVFEERFSSSRMTDEYLAIYRRLIAEEPEPLALTDGVPVA
jgi:glycosyltransferase involved in cell wall biosynthesis